MVCNLQTWISVRKANQEAQETMKKVSEVKKQTDGDSKRINALGEQIKLLQEKIKEAREKASRVSKALVFFPVCKIFISLIIQFTIENLMNKNSRGGVCQTTNNLFVTDPNFVEI